MGVYASANKQPASPAVLWVLYSSFVIAAVIYIFIGQTIQQGGAESGSYGEMLGSFTMIMYGISVVSAVAGLLVAYAWNVPKVAEQFRELDSPTVAGQRFLGRAQVRIIIASVICESLGIYGIVLIGAGGTYASALPLMVGCILVLLLLSPRVAKVVSVYKKISAAEPAQMPDQRPQD